MTEGSLTRLLDQVNENATFHARARQDPDGALAELGLRPWEPAAFTCDDEDALRRLASARIQEDARFWTWVKKGLSKLFCGPGGTRSWECPKAP
jgi:hypothetical protein